MRFLFATLLFALTCFAPHARAAGGTFHPELVRAVAELDAAQGPHTYAALRRIWSSWDRADATHVEEALRAAAANPKLSPPARAYAATLAAYARTRRGDLEGAKREIAALGFVDRWLIVGPFDNEGKAGLDRDLGPEVELDQPVVFGRAYGGKPRAVRWREVPSAFPFGFVDTGSLLRPDQKVCAVLKTLVAAKGNGRAPRPITLWVGSGGAFRAYWNGEEVLADKAYRGHDADRFATRVTLEPGPNDLTLKVCGEQSAPLISVRLGDAKGAPDPDLQTSTALQLTEKTAERIRGKKLAKNAKAKPGQALGPIPEFDKLTSGKRSRPADDFAFARYLTSTGGDDPAEHVARDLARRAAEREPTVERLLLAGELAEDRNLQREWVEKAAALAEKSKQPNVDVLIAQADLALTGANWRAALPILNRALALDPGNLEALHATVGLYNDAGLKRTALAKLEQAERRSPHSVMLLNMLSSQLRALGRDTEAAEVESRYSSLRFDDRTYLSAMIDLAVARRERAAAERWVDRLLGSDPDSQWSHGVAARAYRALGQPERAIATYRRALELAPEDVGTLRTLADLNGELGQRDEQLALLRKVLELRPQDKDVREYVEHITPRKARADEAYAWDAKRFLQKRNAPAAGQTKRTLRDLTVSTVFDNGLSSQYRQVVFQPLTDAAAALSRQYAFQYQADRQVVQLRGARVFRGDGRIDEAIESGESAADNPAISMYTSARNFYVQLPRLEPGDVVELRYRIDDVTPNNEFADYFGEVVYLQSDEPVQNAEYVLITPKSRTIHVDARVTGLKRETKDSGAQRIHRFFAPQVPAVSQEPAMPPWPEVLGFIHVSTYDSWQDLGRWYWGLVREQFDLDAETKKLAREIAKGKTTDLDKVRAVYGWVIDNTRYVALEFGIYGYKPRRCVQTVARGWGDCKDKATVIVTLLEELGIPSTIVILRTQMRGGFASKLPSLAPFDHAIVYVPSLDLYLDGTADYTGTGELPKMDLEALALLVNKGQSKLVTLPSPDPKKNVIARTVNAAVTPTGSAKLELEYEVRGVAAPDWRRRYHAEGTRRERINGDLGRDLPGFEIQAGAQGITTGDLQDTEQPVRLTVRGTAPAFARREGDRLSIAVTPSTRLTPTYASLSTRTQDVRILGFSSVDDRFVVKLPPGARVTSAPPAAQGSSKFGSYAVKVEQSAGQVVVTARLEIHQTRITPKEYGAWKQFCADVDRAFGPRLVVTQ